MAAVLALSLLAALGPLSGATPRPIGAPAAQRDAAADLAEFAAELARLRAGDDTVLPSLRERADRLAAAGRTDPRDVVGFYASLSPEERAEGLAVERRFEALWNEVRGARGATPREWAPRRDAILAELSAIAAERRGAADPTPGARALSLAARLAEQRAREDASLDLVDLRELVEQATEQADEALAIFERTGLVRPRLEPLWLLARTADARGEWREAREGFADALELARELSDRDYQVHALRGLFTLAERSGDRAEEARLLLEIAAIRAPAESWWLARRWAAYLIQSDRAEAAARFLSAHRPRRKVDEREWHDLFGSALQRQGDFEAALAHYRAADLLSEGEGADALERQRRIGEAQIALAAGNPARALALCEGLAQEVRSPSALSQLQHTLGAAQRELGDLAASERSLRASLDLAGRLEVSLERTGGESVFGEVVGLETLALLAAVLAERGDALEAVRVVEEFQARVLREERRAALSRADVAAWAGAVERGLVTWVVGADTTVAAHVAGDGSAVAEVILVGREALHRAIRRTREAAIAGDEARARALAAEIEERILPATIRRRLAGGGRVLCLAHGPLERMPFDLMPIFATGPAPLVLPGLPDTAPGPALAAEDLREWSVLGGPSSANGESVLPGARAEVEAIAKLCRTEAVLGDAFNRGAVVAALKSGRPLHVATHLVHGCAEDGHGNAGLLLARGQILCAREVRAIAPRLPLAVLAACETAEGRFVDAQALQSVSNAFLAAGTRNLCVTLWPVEDAAARAWSQAFHEALERGARPSEAVAGARDALRAAGVSVAEWAAFRLVGRD